MSELGALDGGVGQPRVITTRDVADFGRRNARLIGGMAIAGALVGGAIAVLSPAEFTASASFLPQAPRSGSNLSGIAAQLGVALPQSDGGDSPAFYVELATSRAILGQLADSSFATGSARSAARQKIADLYDIKRDADPRVRAAASLSKLRDLITVSRDRETGVVTVSARTHWAELSRQLTRGVLALVSDFNVHTRQSRASAERAFTAGRLSDARGSLRQAEDALASFQQSNRVVTGSAELGIVRDRLSRAVSERQQIVTSLEQAYEQAKIDEVRDTPVITVIDPPELPATRDSRGFAQKTILGALLGVLCALCWIAGVAISRALSGQRHRDTSREISALDAYHGLAN